MIAFTNGEIILYNAKSKKLVHEFREYSGKILTSISGSPDPDVLAVGFIDGLVSFFEIKKAKNLFSFKIDGAVSSLAFRTDELAHFAVGSARGDVHIFDLDSRKLEHIVPGHSRSVASIFFIPQQPIFVSTSGDNSIKEYLFESSEYRCLRQRSGHYKSPSKVRFIGNDSRFLVSSGSDRSLRFSSIFKDNQNFEFSQGSIKKTASKLKINEEDAKLPEISSSDIFETKTLKWDNMITSHSGQTFAKTWRLDRKTIGQHSFETSDKSVISHVSISSCGNFGILSTNLGSIDIFNLQSGIKRRTIKAFSESKIVASFTDSANTQIISISQKGVISAFDFSKGSLISSFELGVTVINSVINKDTELIAISCSDHTIRVVDFSAMRMVRIFSGHESKINDVIFSSDSKWLISCARDRTIRTWDMASGNLAEILRVENIPISISLSRNLEFLAACHEDKLYISIWSNRSLYTGDCNIVESAICWSQVQSVDENGSTSDIQYSELPSSRWKNIYFLEKIRINTKPIQLTSTKRSALPFFLTQALEQDKMYVENEQENRVSSVISSEEFALFIKQCRMEDKYSDFFLFLKNLHPSKLDFEISCLSADSKLENLQFILKSLNNTIDKGNNFELSHAILALTLRHHEKIICQNRESFFEIIHTLAETIKNKWQPLEELMQSTICLISFAREQ